MNTSFYTAAVGAGGHQEKLNVIANNMANLNTNAYKSRNPVFADLVYTRMTQQNPDVLKGHAMRLDKTDINFSDSSAIMQTDRQMDFAIKGDGFFALTIPDVEDIVYSRDGSFQISNYDGTFYLTDAMGRQVLNYDGEPIEIPMVDEDGNEPDPDTVKDLIHEIGIYHVPIKDGMVAVGDNSFAVVEKNGEVYAQTEDDEEGQKSTLMRGVLELSNVSMPKELSKVIEAQRSFQYALKMVQTSDEIEQTYNELRR